MSTSGCLGNWQGMNGQGQNATAPWSRKNKKKEGFIYFLVYKRRERVREREENGPLQSPLGGGRILDYFGAHSTTHPNQHQYENTDTSHHPASIIPALASVPQR